MRRERQLPPCIVTGRRIFKIESNGMGRVVVHHFYPLINNVYADSQERYCHALH
jgi:hypothetical protein